MQWVKARPVLGILVALALAVSAIGPCHCILNDGACRRGAQEADAHGCCEKPAGVQAAADECCGDAPELVLASTDVPEVAPPALQSRAVVTARATGGIRALDPTHAPPPHPSDRTTILLI
jgi:hypothetical protein